MSFTMQLNDRLAEILKRIEENEVTNNPKSASEIRALIERLLISRMGHSDSKIQQLLKSAYEFLGAEPGPDWVNARSAIHAAAIRNGTEEAPTKPAHE